MRPLYQTLIWAAGLILIGTGIAYYINYNNMEYERNTWYLNGTIIDKQHDSLDGDTCLIDGDDGARYRESCNKYLVGERVELKMQKDYSMYITKRWTD